MISTKKILVLAALLLPLTITAAGTENSQELAQLLTLLPAQSQAENTLIAQALLAQGPDIVSPLCRMLNDTSRIVREQAHYALDGLAQYCATLPATDTSRARFVAGLCQQLAVKGPEETTAFILTLLQTCPDEQALPALQPLLSFEHFADPAAAVLEVIGSAQSAQQLLDELPNVPDGQKVILLNHLAGMRVSKAEPLLLNMAEHKHSGIKRAALSALAELPGRQAETILKQYPDQTLYLRYISRLIATNDKQRAAQRCREILKDAGKAAQHGSALSLLVQADGVAALPELQKAVADGAADIAAQALLLAEPLNSKREIDSWLARLPAAPAQEQAAIIALLGKQRARAAAAPLAALLKAGDNQVKIAAITALAAIQGAQAIPTLLEALRQPQDEPVLQQMKTVLLTLPYPPMAAGAKKAYATAPIPSQKLLLDLMISRRDSTIEKMLLQAATRGDESVRLLALKGLESLGTESSLNALLGMYVKETSHLQRAIQNAVVELVKRTPKSAAAVRTFTQQGTVEQQINMLRIWRGIGGAGSLQVVKSLAQKPGLQEETLRTMLEWPDISALTSVMEIAADRESQTNRILAIRSGLRLVRENSMDDLRRLDLLQQLMKNCERADEKRMVLAELGRVKTAAAVKYAAGFTNDQEIGREACLAIMNMVKPEREDGSASAELAPQRIAASLLEGRPGSAANQEPLLPSNLNKPPEGFTALFNGVDLSGWKGLVEDPVKRHQMDAGQLARSQKTADEEMQKHWQVRDGVLYFDGAGHSLCTSRDYTDFEMYVDWKIEKFGDSGIYLRGSPQVQIWDPAQWPEGSGGLYNNQHNPSKPLVRADKPVGEWNTFHIIMQDDRVTVYLNDVLVVNHVVMENYWERNKPIYRSGQIELQSHNSPLYFRNIYIRELEPKPLFNGKLFNGKDLEGWQVIGGRQDAWQVENGILYTTGEGGGWLSTAREFADFKLELEFRVPKNGNSGVFLRSPHQGDPAYTGMEIQVLDDYGDEYAKLKPWQYTGSVYGIQPPNRRVTKQAGEWQKMAITCQGPQVTVELNGVKTVDTNLIEHMQESVSHPGIKRRAGYIGLQNHSTRLEYRNIFLQELP